MRSSRAAPAHNYDITIFYSSNSSAAIVRTFNSSHRHQCATRSAARVRASPAAETRCCTSRRMTFPAAAAAAAAGAGDKSAGDLLLQERGTLKRSRGVQCVKD